MNHPRKRRTGLAGLVAVLLLAAPGMGIAQDTVDLAKSYGAPKPLPVPHPWPMHHLIHAGTLTVGITAKTPPSSFTNTSGEFDGSRVQLFRKLATDLGLQIEFVRLDWPGILPGLAANRFDLACEAASWSNERLTSPDFLLTRPVNVNATIGIVRRNGGITSWDQVNGRKLGGVKGEIYYETARKVVKASALLDLPGRPEGILALLNGQIDAFAVDLVSARVLLKDTPRGGELTIIGPPLELNPQSLCVNRNEADLLEAVDILLTNYRVDGSLGALEKKYAGTDEHVTLLSAIGY